MLATGPFAVPTFRALLGPPDRYQVVALFTRPQREAHTRDKQQPAAHLMRAMAVDLGLPILEPEDINSPEAQAELTQLAADLLIVCDYGQILSRETLALARLGGINLHGSLLPKYRGAAPIQWAIYHGETETGVTVIHMTPRLDAGPCLVQRSTPIEPNETAMDLEPRLADLGARAVLEAINLLDSGHAAAVIPQDPKLATKAPRLKKTDGLIDWSRPAREIRNQVRAFQPWPKTYSFWRRSEGEPLRLILEDVAAVTEEVVKVTLAGERRPPPGTVISVDKEALMIVSGQGAILPQIVQPAGKRAMSIGEFLRGHAVREGDRFGNAESPARGDIL
ncbi:MAG: methionyl-tRNA formyltransferase [Pirellulales bacterium]